MSSSAAKKAWRKRKKSSDRLFPTPVDRAYKQQKRKEKRSKAAKKAVRSRRRGK